MEDEYFDHLLSHYSKVLGMSEKELLKMIFYEMVKDDVNSTSEKDSNNKDEDIEKLKKKIAEVKKELKQALKRIERLEEILIKDKIEPLKDILDE